MFMTKRNDIWYFCHCKKNLFQMLKEKGKGVSSALICWAFLLIHKVALCSYAIFQKNVKVHYIYKKGSFSVKLVNQPFTKRVRKYCSERRTMGSKFSKGRKRCLPSLFWSKRNLCNLRWLEYKSLFMVIHRISNLNIH